MIWWIAMTWIPYAEDTEMIGGQLSSKNKK